MSELITTRCVDFRWQLLTTVSALSLLGVVASAPQAQAEDTSRPTVWIELGGQLERLQGTQEAFTPAFISAHADAPYNLVPSSATQKAPDYAFGGEGSISFSPSGTDWVFSGSVRYGRSNGTKHSHQQSDSIVKQYLSIPIVHLHATYNRSVSVFNDTAVKHRASQAIVDFTAGKDVGLGLFGRHSIFSLGVRYAQFNSASTVTLRSFPDPYFATNFIGANLKAHHHSYYGHSAATRSFSGVGPSISLSGMSPVAGNPDSEEITFDWGANAAVLFGRQKVKGARLETMRYFHGSKTVSGGIPTNGMIPVSTYNHPAPFARSRSIIIPNLGGFAGMSIKFPNAKVSFGYRADFFFGAMDQGLDLRDSQTQGFHGPFATISIGLGG